MYDKSKRKEFSGSTVAEIIEALQELPADMQMCFCGTSVGYLHVDPEENICSFDYDESISDGYPYEDEQEWDDLADEYGWTTPNVRIYCKDGSVKEIFSKKGR